MSSVYNNQRKQTENQLQKQKKIIENFEIDTSAKMNTVNMKLLKIDETSVIKEYFNSQIHDTKRTIQYILDQMTDNFHQKMKNDIIKSFYVSGVIGPDEPYLDLSAYVKHLQQNSKTVDLTTDDIYTKFSKIKEYGEENVKEVIEDTKDKLVKTISREIKKSSK